VDERLQSSAVILDDNPHSEFSLQNVEQSAIAITNDAALIMIRSPLSSSSGQTSMPVACRDPHTTL